MTGLAVGCLCGTVLWIATHAWCHERYRALESGDLEEIGAEVPSEGLAAALETGIELGTVSPTAALAAHERGILSEDMLARTTDGAYVRGYDRTLAAEAPWIPIFLGMSIVGARTSLAACVLLGAIASSALCDVRFRVIPTPLALSLVPLGILAAPDSSAAPWEMRLLAAIVIITLMGSAYALARWRESSFGGGDVFLLASPLTALVGGHGLAVFLVVLLAELTFRLVRGMTSSTPRDIPLAAYLIAPTAIAFVA